MRLNDHFSMLPEMAFRSLGKRMTLEGGGKSSPPPAPDYTAAAQQTAAGNLATARIGQYGNMVNQYTPQGSVTYTPRTTGYISTSGQSLTPEEYNARRAAGEDLSSYNPLEQWSQTVQLSPEQQRAYEEDAAMNARLRGVAGQGIDYVQQALNRPLSDPGAAQRNVALSDFTQNVAIQPYQNQIADAGQLQRQIENNAAQITTRANDPNLLQQQVTDALYNQQTQYLDPQFAQSQAKLENQLANQGITRGSEAWNNAIQEQGRQKQQAYESARQSAIGQGVGAASTLFGNQLAGLQFGNQALGQQFGQNLQTGQFVNAAQGQQFGQNTAQQQAYNQAQQAMFDQLMANANLKNAAQSQLFNQGLSNAQLYNQALQQDFGNQQTLRQEPINILNAVRTGSQLQSANQPQVGVSQPGQMATVSGPDYLSAATATGQYNQGLYNAQQASNAGLTSGLFGLAGSGLMAYGMKR